MASSLRTSPTSPPNLSSLPVCYAMGGRNHGLLDDSSALPLNARCLASHTIPAARCAGTPIGEPVVQHGPFVMNTRDEIMKTFMDYQTG